MTDHLLKLPFKLERNGAPERWLENIPGMKSISEHGWQWAIADHLADVRVEAHGAIRIALPLRKPRLAGAAIEMNRELPGNLRFAGPGASTLAADSLVDGQAHLPRSFAELETGIALALGDRPTPAVAEPLANAAVSAAIADGNWGDGDVVELPTGWELRPRVRGRVTPVYVTIEQSVLRIHRTIIAANPTSGGHSCLCSQALRFNEQLRHARLALRDDSLIAESRLHAGQITSTWIETAAWAVAVACRHTEDILCVLAEDADAAADFSAVFLDAKK